MWFRVARSWTFNDSSLTYRFLLGNDVTFTTGRRMTAADVVVSLERLRDPEVISSGGWILDAVLPKGIVAVNDSIVDIRLSKPYPPFLGLLTTAYGSILDSKAHLASGSNLKSQPLGSGPFQLAWWLPDAGLVMRERALLGTR